MTGILKLILLKNVVTACVAEYLIRQGELTKLRDADGKLIKKIGNMQKAVVLLNRFLRLETLKRSGLSNFIKLEEEKPK